MSKLNHCSLYSSLLPLNLSCPDSPHLSTCTIQLPRHHTYNSCLSPFALFLTSSPSVGPTDSSFKIFLSSHTYHYQLCHPLKFCKNFSLVFLLPLLPHSGQFFKQELGWPLTNLYTSISFFPSKPYGVKSQCHTMVDQSRWTSLSHSNTQSLLKQQSYLES